VLLGPGWRMSLAGTHVHVGQSGRTGQEPPVRENDFTVTRYRALPQEIEWALPEDHLDRPTPERRWWVPARVEVVGQNLVWSARPGQEVSRLANLWEEFLTLDVDAPQRVGAFARRWGVLGLCEDHGFPMNHLPVQPQPRSETLSEFGFRCPPARRDEGTWIEPLDGWKHWFGRATRLLRVVGRLAEGQSAPEADWRAACEWPELGGDRGPWSPPRTPTEQRAQLARTITNWLRLGQMRASVEWSGREPELFLGGAGLFGAIALQLALAVTRQQGFAICSECWKVYSVKRRPRVGLGRYCATCGAKAANREAQRRRRMRSHSARLPAKRSGRSVRRN
jgi:hypothetical protein